MWKDPGTPCFVRLKPYTSIVPERRDPRPGSAVANRYAKPGFGHWATVATRPSESPRIGSLNWTSPQPFRPKPALARRADG